MNMIELNLMKIKSKKSKFGIVFRNINQTIFIVIKNHNNLTDIVYVLC